MEDSTREKLMLYQTNAQSIDSRQKEKEKTFDKKNIKFLCREIDKKIEVLGIQVKESCMYEDEKFVIGIKPCKKKKLMDLFQFLDYKLRQYGVVDFFVTPHGNMIQISSIKD